MSLVYYNVVALHQFIPTFLVSIYYSIFISLYAINFVIWVGWLTLFLPCSCTSMLAHFPSSRVVVQDLESSSRSWVPSWGAMDSSVSAILCAATCHTYWTGPLSSEVQGGSGPGHRKAPGLRGRPTLALPDLIQGLEGDAKNHARNSLLSLLSLDLAGLAQWQWLIWGWDMCSFARNLGSPCNCGGGS